MMAAALTCMALADNAQAQSNGGAGTQTAPEASVWHAVGRLDIDRGSYCTATLIAPDLVLAAAHCVYDERRVVDPRRVMFRAGLMGGVAVAETAVAQIEVHTKFFPNPLMNPRTLQHDLALLRLAAPLPMQTIPVMATRLPDGPIGVVYYGEGLANSLSQQQNCTTLGQRDVFLAFSCDGFFGSTGAHVFTLHEGRLHLASILSDQETSNGRRVLLGIALPDMLEHLKDQMAANQGRSRPGILRLNQGTVETSNGAKFVRP